MKNNTPGLCELNNIGNSCYINSIFQCLLSSGFFTLYLIKNGKSIDRNNSSKLTFNLINLFQEMLKNNQNYDIYIIKIIIDKLTNDFIGNHQHDSQEFLNFLLNTIHEENKYETYISSLMNNSDNIINSFYLPHKYNKINNCKLNKLANSSVRDAKLQASLSEVRTLRNELALPGLAIIEWKKYVEKSYSIIIDLFFGMFYNEIICNICKNISLSFEIFSILSLPILNKEIQELNDCFKSFFDVEELTNENQYFCNNCNKNIDKCFKKSYIWHTSLYLIMHLKRFDSSNNKKNNIVKVPLLFNLSNNYENNSIQYELFAVNCHNNNSTNSGHYVSYCKNFIDNEWYFFDDKIINKINMNEIILNESIHRTAYILFYRRINND